MATSSSFTQILSGVQVDYDDEGKHAAATVPAAVVHLTTKSKTYPHWRKWRIVWRNVIAFTVMHVIAVYGFYLIFCGHVKVKTLLCMMVISVCSAFGITVGAHRLWAHRCYNARLPMRVLLAVFQTLAFQNHIYEWARDHRVHHKFTDTDADPHNSSRGFFFSHMGWLMVRKHPDVAAKGSAVDMTDLEADPVVMWQKKYYLWLVPIITFLIPSLIPYWVCNERFLYSFVVVGVTRYMLSLHFTWLVNSAAHIWGTKPYDKNITPTENPTVALLAFGEGWHNYHHAFPWDYKAAELGNYRLNLSTAFIDLCARLGQAYNLKTANASLVEKRSQRTGDGTKDHNHNHRHNPHHGEFWGWGDEDMAEDDKRVAKLLY
ncbi:acyl-CoA Delta(11) desaturase-like [Sipha flava]|uniref:Acyl-CoA Delta(11) desaturase-like n=1 Tax=Sipha flava TaxID=143950 RepID=A0A8B8FX90_9HEMI|nr:acyl-CoA Delta(11) desaturase-like [Sipha flava]XP_025414961.1 acyl-CoA Delta(11) desaturase-like [Sipha flava]XP_025414969.1 acyl-CoA Delta(11) desaturase-like [Sipha flava]XP_025414975.1 acyl-CoA Delta(11) desaturase-like [Sipha flava]